MAEETYVLAVKGRRNFRTLKMLNDALEIMDWVKKGRPVQSQQPGQDGNNQSDVDDDDDHHDDDHDEDAEPKPQGG